MLKPVLFLAMGGVMAVVADYGYKPVFPKLKIKKSGASKTHNWVGYTQHYPRAIPRPPVLYKWDPYTDPIYTAFWVSGASKIVEHDHGHHGHSNGQIPHGFGPPKSISHHHGHHGSFEDDFGFAHGFDSFKQPSVHHESHMGGNAIKSFDSAPSIHHGHTEGKQNQGFGIPKPSSIDFSSVNHQASSPSIVSNVPAQAPVVILDDDSFEDFNFQTNSFDDSREVQGIHIPIQSSIGNSHAFNQASIEPGQLLHSEQFSDDHFLRASPQHPISKPEIQTDVVPLVKLPHSAPLPLENEGIFTNSLNDGFDIHIKTDS